MRHPVSTALGGCGGAREGSERIYRKGRGVSRRLVSRTLGPLLQ